MHSLIYFEIVFSIQLLIGGRYFVEPLSTFFLSKLCTSSVWYLLTRLALLCGHLNVQFSHYITEMPGLVNMRSM